MNTPQQPPGQIMVEFLSSSGEPLRLIDLGADFVSSSGAGTENAEKPFRVALFKQRSKKGNAFYDYSQNALPLPDGLSTFVRVDGTIVPMGKIRPSQKGYPTREGTAQLLVGGLLYTVTVYLTESRSPFYVKVIAHKTPNRKRAEVRGQNAPKGGALLF